MTNDKRAVSVGGLVFSIHMSGVGPLRQILQRKRMLAFRVVAEVTAGCFK